jgi:hypothetical protein
MKTLPLLFAIIFSFGITSAQAETTDTKTTPTKPTSNNQQTVTQQTTSTTTTKPTKTSFTVIAIQEKGATPTQKTIGKGATFVLFGKAVTPPPGTKIDCCKNQDDKLVVPLYKFEDLQAYDLNKEGVIDHNEAGYYGLYVAKTTDKHNVVKTMTLKEAGIKNITLPTATEKSPVVEFNNQEKAPLVIVTLPG